MQGCTPQFSIPQIFGCEQGRVQHMAPKKIFRKVLVHGNLFNSADSQLRSWVQQKRAQTQQLQFGS